MLLPNPRGNFHYIKGNPSFSSAVIADPGYAIVHVTFANPLPVPEGFDFLAEYLRLSEPGVRSEPDRAAVAEPISTLGVRRL